MRFSSYAACMAFSVLALSSSIAAQPLPPDAQAVIDRVHVAAQARDFAALEKSMAVEFVWSFGGDSDVQQALESWREHPEVLYELQRITAAACVVQDDGGIECPTEAGDGYRARFEKLAAGWRMVSFLAGD